MFNKQRDIPMTVLIGVWIGLAFGVAAVRAAEPSARSFVQAIYEHYKGGKKGKRDCAGQRRGSLNVANL